MAINLETLVAVPKKERKPNVTEDEAREILRKKIDNVIKVGDSQNSSNTSQFFSVDNQPLANIGGTGYLVRAKLIEREKAQAVAIELMQEYGVNLEIFVDEERDKSKSRTYPARDGLSFKRRVSYLKDGRPTRVTWDVRYFPERKVSPQ